MKLSDAMQSLGATRKQLAPLGGVIWVSFEPLTPEQIQIGQELWRRLVAGEV